ncbi:MAG: hypothetical protein LH618_12385, partial [Saprospiraceae bacterium]|nr:hypothetical protein [Saprospiraceae bacterium]
SGWLKSRKVARTSDAALAGTLQSNLYVGRTMAWEKQLDDHVASLTLPQLNAAMKKYLDYSRMIAVKAGDFGKGKKP